MEIQRAQTLFEPPFFAKPSTYLQNRGAEHFRLRPLAIIRIDGSYQYPERDHYSPPPSTPLLPAGPWNDNYPITPETGCYVRVSMATAPTASRTTRPPFRFQHTQDSSSPRSYPQEKSRDPELLVFIDEKAPTQSFGSSSSHSSGHRGHVRTTSRDATHNQSATSRMSSDGRPSSQYSPRSQQPLPHRLHSHPPPPSFSVHRQVSPVEVTTCCGFPISPRAKAWIPFGSWIMTSLAFIVAIGWWKEEVFLGELGFFTALSGFFALTLAS